MLRTKDWKYVHRYPYGPHELYHLSEDPGERCNVISDESCQPIAAEMKEKLESWYVHYTDPSRDGTKEPVTGSGQLNLAGPAGHGAKAFEWFED
jgi:arylsulfatase A-like enzyme